MLSSLWGAVTLGRFDGLGLVGRPLSLSKGPAPCGAASSEQAGDA
ncbi:hypothetical protein [Microbacterium sp.]|nr:hypothetical protein [Microbacterium sp.]